MDRYDEWYRLCIFNYYDYAKNLCEQCSFLLRKYQLCMVERWYIGISKEDLLFLKRCLKTVLREYTGYFEQQFVTGQSIRKYVQAHDLNRSSADHLQRKLSNAMAYTLKERDEAEGTKLLYAK